MAQYLIDSNVFIQAKNLHYGFDFCPAFWEWLVLKNKAGIVASVEKVRAELLVIDDELSGWVDTLDKQFFLLPDERVMDSVQQVNEWVIHKQYRESAIRIFQQDADSWLIAHALALRSTVVTHEVPADTAKKVKMPNVCTGLKLISMSPYEMLRRERANFVLGKS
ncbi:MAG: DUF4411 family protein [Gammaproteobacteria bacterium]|nr:DUF4411 family protein [Gammaproteobacteria bacterium]MYF54043.1 DUF4411 family protein [Gammaproteobacteria bacterium]MYK43899.1 DUF4411 family protein [Gammaproteobacteria bacterium]